MEGLVMGIIRVDRARPSALACKQIHPVSRVEVRKSEVWAMGEIAPPAEEPAAAPAVTEASPTTEVVEEEPAAEPELEKPEPEPEELAPEELPPEDEDEL